MAPRRKVKKYEELMAMCQRLRFNTADMSRRMGFSPGYISGLAQEGGWIPEATWQAAQAVEQQEMDKLRARLPPSLQPVAAQTPPPLPAPPPTPPAPAPPPRPASNGAAVVDHYAVLLRVPAANLSTVLDTLRGAADLQSVKPMR